MGADSDLWGLNPAVWNDVGDMQAFRQARRTIGYSPDKASILAEHPDAQVRVAVAGYEGVTTPETLRRLQDDPYTAVRAELACNPDTPLDVLEKLVQDDHLTVRCRVADHPGASPDILECLHGSLCHSRLSDADHAMPWLYHRDFAYPARLIVEHRNTSDWTLIKIAARYGPGASELLKSTMLERATAPAEALRYLAPVYSEPMQQRALLRQPYLDGDLLRCIQSQSWGIDMDVFNHPRALPETLENLLGCGVLPEADYRKVIDLMASGLGVFEALLTLGDDSVDMIVVNNHHTPGDLLVLLMASGNEQLRRRAAEVMQRRKNGSPG